MNSWAPWIPAIVAVIGIIYNSGILSNKVASHDKRLDAHAAEIKAQGLSIVKLEAWNDGYNAATRPPTHGTTH